MDGDSIGFIRNGPHGEARAWLAIDGDQETVIGVAAAFPRRFYAKRQTKSLPGCWVIFVFTLQYRSLGPALQLQRACLGVRESNGEIFL